MGRGLRRTADPTGHHSALGCRTGCAGGGTGGRARDARGAFYRHFRDKTELFRAVFAKIAGAANIVMVAMMLLRKGGTCDDINEAMRDLREGRNIRGVIAFDGA